MLHWGILGTSYISSTVINAIQQSGSSTINVIAGRSVERLIGLKAEHEIARHSVGFDTVLQDPEIDVVYIGTPNHTHHELTIMAAENGKAVLSEKSLTTTMEEARALVAGVMTNGTFFVEGLMYLAHPLYRRLAEVLTDGRLGDLRAVNGYYAADIWQVTNPQGKGTIYNLGCYPASLLQFVVQTMCGEETFAARQIAGFGNRSVRDGTICDASVSVRFAGGVLATLQSSDSYGMAHDFSIAGDNGVLQFRTNPWLPVAGRNHLEWHPYKGDREDIFVDDEHDSYYHQIKMVETAITANQTQAKRPSPRLSDSLELMEFLTEWETQCLSNIRDPK